MKHRQEKRSEYIKELISEFIQTESNGTSLVTVTRFEMENKDENATFYVSVMPEDQEQAVLDFIMRRLSDIRRYVMEHIPSGRIPFLSAEIDKGEKLRRKIDALA
jgi:ribosome-binding factor A